MFKKLTILFLLSLITDNCFAAQANQDANQNKVGVTIMTAISDEGHDQRIIEAKLGKYFVKKIITFIVNSETSKTLDMHHQCSIHSNCDGSILKYLMCAIEDIHQDETLKFIYSLAFSTKSVKNYWAIRANTQVDVPYTIAELEAMDDDKKENDEEPGLAK